MPSSQAQDRNIKDTNVSISGCDALPYRVIGRRQRRRDRQMQGRHCVRNVEGMSFIVQQLVIPHGTLKLGADFRISFRVEPFHTASSNEQHAAYGNSTVLQLVIQLAINSASEQSISAPGQYYDQERE